MVMGVAGSIKEGSLGCEGHQHTYQHLMWRHIHLAVPKEEVPGIDLQIAALVSVRRILVSTL